MTPKGLLFDYGGTLVEELSVDLRAGNEWLLARASYRPPHVTLDHVLERATRVAREVSARRDEVQLETPWSTLTRLIHDSLGVRFETPMPELELGFWNASVRTQAMPGARAALEQFHRWGLPLGVVSNTGFGEPVIRHELARYGSPIIWRSSWCRRTTRCGNRMCCYTRRRQRVLNVKAGDIWFVGDRLDTDVTGAKAAGMTAVWFNPQGRANPLSDVDLTVSGWADLVGHVGPPGAVNGPPEQSY
jgi:FMN phosphatase YigB (HAD superfamily)